MGAVHTLFEKKASEAPDRTALVSGAVLFTYGDLDARANGLARSLLRRGVGPETLVPLRLDRSPDLLVALLAVCKAGGAAVLLDPGWPEDRVAAVLDGAPVVIDGPVDAFDAFDAGPSDERPGVAVHEDQLAYAVHTSGSTGRPKLVGVTHRAIAHRVATHAEAYRITPGDRSSWLAPPASSVSVVELWPYLCSGASVHVADAATAGSPPELRDWMVASGITRSYVNMPLAELLYGLPWPGETALRLMTVGSDAVRVWPSPGLPFEVAVEYGSAEANGVTSCLVPLEDRCTSVTADETARRARPPIGRAWPGVGVPVLTSGLEPVAAGEVGELFVSGPELARGYLGEPARTAERFLPDPSGGGGRVYRTGDLVRERPDGRLEHHGRVDQQVKIRGHRVEPAEVEAVLLDHPAVRECVVTGVPGPGGDLRLCAYVVYAATTADDMNGVADGAARGVADGVADGVSRSVADGAARGVADGVADGVSRSVADGVAHEAGEPRAGEPRAGELRAFAAARLPAPMVPTAWTAMERLPLNSSNKVDRRALPAPSWGGPPGTGLPESDRLPGADDSKAAPRGDGGREEDADPVTAGVLELWEQALGARGALGDHFIRSGGDSLSATRLVERIGSRYGVRIRLRDFLRAPTPETLIRNIKAEGKTR
ncbi:non-ribosomal peptide synthetase [Streptosporangium sp. NPDC002721]|uniref:non-ribosomal peptide synthetase n=1 Tax=Streptosporangium sp. NPDC002721 TaxID=3366188 RepID=UPI003674E4BE